MAAEVLKSWWHRAHTPPIYFYRDRDGREVDLVFDVDGKLWPVEIKRAATVRREWVDPFAALEEDCRRGNVETLERLGRDRKVPLCVRLHRLLSFAHGPRNTCAIAAGVGAGR